jgi:exopolysaccharide production protein ExoY
VYRAEQVLAAFALLLSMPACAAIAVIVFLLSGRGPLIRHWRVGRYGAMLGVLKFRTMWKKGDPRSSFFAIEDIVNKDHAPELKIRADARVTSRFATFCRRHSLDEIPQLFHVLTGEMSLVGPRPLTEHELRTWYGTAATTILALRPGLTGLWQVLGRNRLTYPQRRRLDLFFAQRASARLYLLILLRTIPSIVFGKDAF